ncbi:hypothetical protein LCGC14_2772360 [marine sediment metagenome]|uniref:Uncharacterized protein n=1 Tax=marine sediment metagenome TaxID=412755 RepID=A0A0F8ZHM0_9ZZZZ
MIKVIIRRGAGDKEAPAIQDERITSEQMAIRLGTNFINENWYLAKRRRLRCPHVYTINDSKVAAINEGNIPISGNHWIKSVTIQITPTSVLNNLEVEDYEDFF